MYKEKILNWCLFRPDQLEKLLDTNAVRGLSPKEAARRSTRSENTGREIRELFYPFATFLRCLFGVLSDFSVLLLVLSSAVCAFFSDTGLSAFGAVMLFVVLSALVRAFIEVYGKKAEDDGDKDCYAVIRDGKRKRVKGKDIVPGDLIIVTKGDIVPCDIRLISTNSLRVIEKYDDKRVTAVEKDAEYYPVNPTGKIALRFKKNMLFGGSAVTSGEGMGLVLPERMTFDEAGEILGLSSSVRRLFEYEVRSESSDLYTRITGRSAFGASRSGVGGGSDKSTVRVMTERIMTVARILGLLSGTVIFAVAIVSKTLITDAFLFSCAVMAIAPSALYELCIAVSFFAGQARLKAQGITVRDFESAEKLAMSKSIILCGSTGYKIDSMVLRELWFGDRQIDLAHCKPSEVKSPFEMLLYAADLEVSADRKSIKGDLEGLALLEAAGKYGGYASSDIRKIIEGNERQYDMNGALLRTRVSFATGYIILERGTAPSVLQRCDKTINGKGEICELTKAERDRIAKHARALDNIEGTRVVALCGIRQLPSLPDAAPIVERPIFICLAVYGTKVSIEGTRYVDILRGYGIKPIIFAGEVSDAVIDNSRRLGILRAADNYMTGKTYERVDERIFKDEFSSYTLFMNLDGNAKRAIIAEKKRSEGVITVAADRPGDAFDMSDCDVLVSCGEDAPKTLRRISDIHSDKSGIDGIFRTVCICRNIIRSASLATGYLICAGVAATVFALLGVFLGFMNGGQLPMRMPQYILSVFVADLVIAMLTAFIKTPKSIIKDDPDAFYGYYEPSAIIPKALISGTACGLVTVAAYLVGLLTAKSHEAGSLCAFSAMYLSKALVSLVCIMPTGTRIAPAPTPVAAIIGELVLAAIFALFFGKAFVTAGFGLAAAVIVAAISVIPTLIAAVFVKAENQKDRLKRKSRK